MTEVKRQDSGSYILKSATEIRNSMEQGKCMPAIKAPSLKKVF